MRLGKAARSIGPLTSLLLMRRSTTVTLIKRRVKMMTIRMISLVYPSITLIMRLSKSRFKKMTLEVYREAKLVIP
jgi:hypothetical protein